MADSAREIEALQAQLQALDRRLAQLESSIQEAQTTLSSLLALQGNSGPVRLPLGTGIFIEVEASSSPLLRAVGAGYIVEENLEDTQKAVIALIEQFKQEFSALSNRAQEVADRYDELTRA